MASPISNTAMQLPSILHINTNYMLELNDKAKNIPTYNTHLHCVTNYDKQNRANVRLKLSEETSVDACEYMHAIYEDLSQINDILSLQDPTLILEGTALFFSGFEVTSSLEPIYLQALSRVASFHGLFERSFARMEEVIVDGYHMDPKSYGLN